jgi:hypothetical protein
MQNLLREFQKQQNLKADGVAGLRTYMRLNQLGGVAGRACWRPNRREMTCRTFSKAEEGAGRTPAWQRADAAGGAGRRARAGAARNRKPLWLRWRAA